jgi:hypothetical protein
MSVILVRLFKNPALLSVRPHISTIISCVGSWSIPAECSFSRAQFSAIVNTEPEEHTTDVPKRELPGMIGDSLSPELDAHAAWESRTRAEASSEDERALCSLDSPARQVSSEA